MKSSPISSSYHKKEDTGKENNQEFKNPGATVDLIVPHKEGLIYIKRLHEPYKDMWALPGGFLNYGTETLEHAGVRELFEETSLRAQEKDLKLFGVYSAPERDPRGHTISHTYVVTKFTGTPKANDDAKEIAVFNEMPKNLAFDHKRIISDYYKKEKLYKN
jgi:ADP-ribose pyrophosphatase YjhB (NUDIX family)